MNKAVFLDRDGVINIDKAYVYKIEDFEFCQGVFEALKHFQNLGYLLIVVTNQSGIGRGYYREEDFQHLTQWMKQELQKCGVAIDAVYYCPHAPEAMCNCRKPKSGMFENAIKALDIDVNKSWMIGDKESDIQAAHNVKIPHTVLISHETFPTGAKYCVNDLFGTINLIQS